MQAIPTHVTWKNLRSSLKSVAIKELRRSSRARKLAGRANLGSGDSYVRGKDEFKDLAKLLEAHATRADSRASLSQRNRPHGSHTQDKDRQSHSTANPNNNNATHRTAPHSSAAQNQH